MLSVHQLRSNLYPIFRVLKNTGTTLEVIHEGKVYEFGVRLTDKEPEYKRRKRAKVEVLPQRIDISECPSCGYVLIAGVCMNKKCPTVVANAQRTE
jgi:hypothetical protein